MNWLAGSEIKGARQFEWGFHETCLNIERFMKKINEKCLKIERFMKKINIFLFPFNRPCQQLISCFEKKLDMDLLSFIQGLQWNVKETCNGCQPDDVDQQHPISQQRLRDTI